MAIRPWIACTAAGLAIATGLAMAASMWSGLTLTSAKFSKPAWDSSLVDWWDDRVPFELTFHPPESRPPETPAWFEVGGSYPDWNGQPFNQIADLHALGIDVRRMTVVDVPGGAQEASVISYRAGFPWRAFEGQSWSTSRGHQLVNAIEAPNWLLFDDPRELLLAERVLPTEVLPLGLLGNVLVWALAVWIPLFGIRRLRHSSRARRGLCQACCYPASSSERCSECGVVA